MKKWAIFCVLMGCFAFGSAPLWAREMMSDSSRLIGSDSPCINISLSHMRSIIDSSIQKYQNTLFLKGEIHEVYLDDLEEMYDGYCVWYDKMIVKFDYHGKTYFLEVYDSCNIIPKQKGAQFYFSTNSKYLTPSENIELHSGIFENILLIPKEK